MKKTIEFIDTTRSVAEEYYPKPAKRSFPEWYKDLHSYPEEFKEMKPTRAHYGTVKKCAPFLDAISSGYIIFSDIDIYVSDEKDETGSNSYYWPDRHKGAVSGHVYKQVEGYPDYPVGKAVPKFTNPWAIKTPKGYSTLFLTPMHQDIPFRVMEGIVDTDTYNIPVEILFYLKDPNFSGHIPAGTPIVHVLPFKRDEWEMEARYPTAEDEKMLNQTDGKLNSLFVNRYRKLFWERKSFN